MGTRQTRDKSPASEDALRALLASLPQAKGESAVPAEQFAFLIRSTADAIIGRSEDGKIISWNPGAERIYGYTAAEAIGQPISILSPSNLAGDILRLLERSREGGSATLYETLRRRKDGTLITVTTSVTPIRDARGRVAGTLTVSREVADSGSASTAEPAPLALYRRLLDHAPCGICRVDSAGAILYANQPLAAILGYPSAEALVGLNLKTQLFRDPQACARLFEQAPRASAGPGAEAEWRKSDGAPVHVRLTCLVAGDARNQRACYEVFVDDVERRRFWEGQVRQAQTMDALCRLAGKVAHDFNNVLGVIMGYAQILHERLEPHDVLHHSLEEIVNTVDQAASLTRQLLGFSRRLALEPCVFSLEARLRDLQPRLQHLLGPKIRLVLCSGAGLGHIHADPAAIDQVILNLAVHGREAMPGGGRLTIDLVEAVFTSPRDSLPPGAYLRLTVADTGPAIGAHELARVFEPFLSTSSRSSGAGLGLATVYEIVRQSGAYIWAGSEPGKGAAFTIHFPRVEKEQSAARQAPPRPGSAPRRAKSRNRE